MMNSMVSTDGAERILWIDIMKGIGIILVILGHLYTNDIISKWLYSFHMPLFFFAAGFVYKQKDNIVYMKRRMQTVLIPYYSFGVLTLLYWQFLERRFRASTLSFGDSLLGLLIGKYDLLDFNVHLWFLPCFFLTVVLYNFLRNLLGKEKTYIVVFVISLFEIIIDIQSIFILPELPYGINRMIKYIGFYSLGNICAEYRFESILFNTKRNKLILATFLLMVSNFLLAFWGFTNNIMWFVTASVGILGVMVLAVLISGEKLSNYGSKLLGELGEITLCILCVHGLVYRILTKIASVILKISTDTIRSNLVGGGVIALFTLLICRFLYGFLKRFVPWIFGETSKLPELSG